MVENRSLLNDLSILSSRITLSNCLDFKTLSNIYVMFGFRKVLWKKKMLMKMIFLCLIVLWNL